MLAKCERALTTDEMVSANVAKMREIQDLSGNYRMHILPMQSALTGTVHA